MMLLNASMIRIHVGYNYLGIDCGTLKRGLGYYLLILSKIGTELSEVGPDTRNLNFWIRHGYVVGVTSTRSKNQ